MANEIVKYGNQLNEQPLRGMTATDLDLLMSIASRVRDKGEDEVTLSFDDLRHLAGLQDYKLTDQDLAKRLAEVNKRLLALNFELHDNDKAGNLTRIIQFALFQEFEVDIPARSLRVAVSSRFRFLLNALTSGFTRFELSQFTELKSSYAKEAYRRLKQFRSTGVWRVGVEDFRRLLDVPRSYTAGDLAKRVLGPIEAELGPLMHLSVERVMRKTTPGRGRSSLVALVFRFDKEAAKAPAVSSRPAKGDLGLIHTKYGQQYQGEWNDAELLAHLHGSVDQGECPVCAAWESNRARHGCMGA